MTGWPELDRFLRTDPRDVGCAQAMEMLHIYAELAGRWRSRGGALPRSRRAPARLRPVRGRLRRAADRLARRGHLTVAHR
jgi:hypothetical protein